MTTYRVTARFSDGEERSFSVSEDETLLHAALAEDVNLIHQCQAGSCSSCICQTVEGRLEMDTGTSIALLPREVAEGKVLSCLTRVRSDAVVEFPYESALLDRAGSQQYLAEVTGCDRLSETAFELRVRLDLVDEGMAPGFQPGAYFLIKVPGTEESRPYSIASIPSDLPEMRFLIRYLPGGVMSGYLAETCQTGDFVEIEGPYGDFILRETTKPLVMVAGGTGLAPIISMLDSLREARRHRAGISVYFGVRTYGDLFYLEELGLRREMMPRLDYHIIVEQADPRWSGPVGRVTDLLSETQLDEGTTCYLCGPPGMIAAATERLIAAGLPTESIFYERFTPAASLAHSTI